MSATSSRRSPTPERVDQTAQDLVELLGGPANIHHFSYCFTKLRLCLVDRAVVNDTALLAHPAVMGLIEDDTYQVMLGPAVVEHVAHALAALLVHFESIASSQSLRTQAFQARAEQGDSNPLMR